MMPPRSVRITLAPWFRVLAAALLAASAFGAPPASLKLGVASLERKQWPQAIRQLRGARAAVPQLRDYVAFWLATAQMESGNAAAAIEELAPFWNAAPASPHLPAAALLASRAYRQIGTPAEAVAVLRRYYAHLPQPAGDLALAASYEAASDLPSAAAYYQRVYYAYPSAAEAAKAAAELPRLKAALGGSYPPVTAGMMMERAERWMHAGEYQRARAEYEAMIPFTAGASRDQARVRVGAAQYHARATERALEYLRSLEVASPEADAERWHYLAECARRLDREWAMQDALNQLRGRHPQSLWRLKALVSAGNYYLVKNLGEQYEPLFRAAADGFPAEPEAEYCHWKFAWRACLNRRADAAALLREHLLRFPGGEKAGAALYFLGRLAEERGDHGAARAYYEEAGRRYANDYYGELAAGQRSNPSLFGAAPAAETVQFLKQVAWPEPRHLGTFEPSPATRMRQTRANLLAAAGLDGYAEKELRFGAKTDAQPHVLAMDLARTADRNGSPFQAMRNIKSLVPGYLAFPLDTGPAAFWKLLFPLPYRAEMEKNAKLRGIDPCLLAGLIRQESEFNPKAVSAADAYGLTQIRPATGRDLLRKLGQRRFSSAMLFRPEINLRLGTIYLRQLRDHLGNGWEPALAAYNAGGSRAREWLGWARFREPAEFIETIPFRETRTYVLAVLRNAQIYRRLYAAPPPPARPAARPGRKR